MGALCEFYASSMGAGHWALGTGHWAYILGMCWPVHPRMYAGMCAQVGRGRGTGLYTDQHS